MYWIAESWYYIRFSHLVCYDPRMNNILIENTNLCLPNVNHALDHQVEIRERFIGTIKVSIESVSRF